MLGEEGGTASGRVGAVAGLASGDMVLSAGLLAPARVTGGGAGAGRAQGAP